MSEQTTLSARLRFLAVAGVGFFLDGYLNIVIGLGTTCTLVLRSQCLINFAVVPMIGYIYFKENKGSVPTIKGDEIKGALSLGMIFGQLCFGLFGDALGRRKVYGKELLFTSFGTLMVILLPWKGLSRTGVVTWIAVWRVVTGVGIGGGRSLSDHFYRNLR